MATTDLKKVMYWRAIQGDRLACLLCCARNFGLLTFFCHRNKEGDDKILTSRSVALRYTELKVCDEVVEERGKVVQCDVTNLNE